MLLREDISRLQCCSAEMSVVSEDTILTSHELGALALQSQALSYPTVVTKEQLYTSLPLPTASTNTIYIRLLVLEAPSTSRNWNANSHQLKARLCVQRLTKDLRFAALSYVWGQYDSSPHTICCRPQRDDSPITYDIPITANCHAALSQIRAHWAKAKIWVDAICMNQDDDEEKSSQIAHMQEIFGWAETVYVWLGKGNPQSDQAMRYLKTRGQWKARFPFTCLALTSMKPEQREQAMVNFTHRAWRDVLIRLTTTFGDGLHQVDLHEVLGRAWVRRAWTLQEIVLARNPVILCGEKVLPWEDLIHAIYDPSYIRKLDVPHGATRSNPAGDSIAEWCSVIDIWLNIPRHSPDQPMQDLPGRAAISFATLAKQLELEKKIPRAPSILSYFCNILCWSWSATCSGFFLYGTVLFMIFMRTRTSINKDKGRWYPLVFAWLYVAYVFAKLVQGCLGYFCFILLGGHAGWFLKRPESGGMHVLSGLHVALRERDCTDPRDRSFAMFGILQSLGASFSTPKMQQTVGQTHRLFLENMLRWQPHSLAMIVDAGRPLDDAPSWVPNWMLPCPSKWLTWRYTIGSSLSATKVPMRSDILVDGNKLTLGSHSEGQVCFVTTHTPTVESCLATILCMLRSIRDNVKQQVPYDVPESFLFAIFHGLTPPRGPTTKEVKTFDDMGNETGSENRPLPRWKGPYDFEQRKLDFNAFCRLYQLLQTCLQSLTSEDSNQATTEHIDISRAMERIRSSKGCCKYFVDVVNMLSAEKRCLFVTKTGRVGSGPVNMKVGDEVFLLAGVPVPMVLYNHTGTASFMIRGAALIHGLMHGESFASKQLRQITLV